MPYKSDRQRKFFNWAAKNGKMPQDTVDEFNKASKGMDMPEHLAEGGMTGDDYDVAEHGGEDYLVAEHGGDSPMGMKSKDTGDYEDTPMAAADYPSQMNPRHREMNDMRRADPMHDVVNRYASGGVVGDNPDNDMMHYYDSSGEPGTEDDMEETHPMSFMSKGGIAGMSSPVMQTPRPHGAPQAQPGGVHTKRSLQYSKAAQPAPNMQHLNQGGIAKKMAMAKMLKHRRK